MFLLAFGPYVPLQLRQGTMASYHRKILYTRQYTTFRKCYINWPVIICIVLCSNLFYA